MEALCLFDRSRTTRAATQHLNPGDSNYHESLLFSYRLETNFFPEHMKNICILQMKLA